MENRFERVEVNAPVGTIVVLGGATNGRIGQARGVTELNSAGDRIVEAVALARRFPEAKVLFSGGIGALIAEGETEAESSRRLMMQLGLDGDRIVLEGASRNTEENVAYTAALIEGEGDIVLVTSAFHMPRAMGLFRNVGIEPVPWPTDYRSTGEIWFGIDIANPILNLEVATIAIREWIGLLAYNWSGRTSELFPAQR